MDSGGDDEYWLEVLRCLAKQEDIGQQKILIPVIEDITQVDLS